MLLLNVDSYIFSQKGFYLSRPTGGYTLSERKYGSLSTSYQVQLNGYREYTFGLSIEMIKALLTEDTQFLYEGDSDVTLLEPQDRTIISVFARGALISVFFIFYEERLYEIILEANEQLVNYFSLYNQLIVKYGDPIELNPQRVKWEIDDAILILERSLLIKYIDRNVLEKIGNRFKSEKEKDAQLRERLLDQL